MSGLSGLSDVGLQKIRGERKIIPKPGPEAPPPPTGKTSQFHQSQTKGLNDPFSDDDEDSSSDKNESDTPAVVPKDPVMERRLKMKINLFIGEAAATSLATINSPWNSAEMAGKQLSDLREAIAKHVKTDYTFSLQDKSNVPEDMLVIEYLEETIPPMSQHFIPPGAQEMVVSFSQQTASPGSEEETKTTAADNAQEQINNGIEEKKPVSLWPILSIL
jgi:hypothetical protein